METIISGYRPSSVNFIYLLYVYIERNSMSQSVLQSIMPFFLGNLPLNLILTQICHCKYKMQQQETIHASRIANFLFYQNFTCMFCFLAEKFYISTLTTISIPQMYCIITLHLNNHIKNIYSSKLENNQIVDRLNDCFKSLQNSLITPL